jgi:hypothetical protein
VNQFEKTVGEAYANTLAAFQKWSEDEAYRPYVVPEATAPKPGFAIFYTPRIMNPRLLIVGQNPANFAGRGPLTAFPNGVMLSAEAPTRNSYLEDDHGFAVALRQLFACHLDLLQSAVGMNVWHFQASSAQAVVAPRELRRFCQATTLSLIEAMKPAAVLCFGKRAFNVVRQKIKGTDIDGTKALRVTTPLTQAWYVRHATGSWTKDAAFQDTPVVLAEIDAYIASRA